MKEYIVKVIYKAKPNNFNFKGEVDVWYHGKGGDATQKYDLFRIGLMRGWKKRHFAERHIQNEPEETFWYKRYEIIEIEVPEKGAGL